MLRRPLLLSLALLALLIPASAASAAPTWTEIPSGTTAEITAIEYQGDTRFWFTTASGEIFTRQGDGTFLRKFGPSGVRLNDIEFQAGGNIGLAVGAGGQVLRSVDAGATWTNANSPAIPVSRKGTTFPDCTAAEPLGDVNSVRFASNARAWIFAEGSQVARSQPANAANVGAAGQWVDANRTPENTCKLPSGYGDGYADGFFVPSNPDVGYIVAEFDSQVFFTSNNLAGSGVLKSARAGNGGSLRRTLVGDPDNPSRMWAVAPTPYGISTTNYTDDGYSTSRSFVIGNSSRREFTNNGAYDVAFKGGTVLAAGDAGMILNSIDGPNFFYVDAGGALATQDWRAVALASADKAAVGGVGGKLALGSAANTIPDLVAPTGTIAGPDTTPAGRAVQFTLQAADEAGGSGVNPASFAWSSTGLPAATGNPVSFTFPNPGSYTVKVTFRDVAGNTAETTKTVTVTAAVLPVTSFPANAAKGITVKRSGRYFTFKVKGTLLVPAGVAKSAVCPKANGMKVRIKKGKKTIKNVRANLSKTCSYAKTIKVLRKSIGKSKTVTVVLEYPGNAVVGRSLRSFKKKVQ